MRRPALPDEPGRGGFRQGRFTRAIYLAQRLDGSHERGGRRHAFEFERFEEGGRPTPNAGIALAENLVGVELLGPRQCLRFRDARPEALPRDHCRNCAEGVLLGLMGGDQGRADARVETNLFIDGFGVTLKGAGVSPLGLAKHRADQTIKHIDGLIGQTGGNVQTNGDQRCVSPAAFVTSDMLGGGAPGFARKLGETRLMDQVATTWFDANPDGYVSDARSDRAWRLGWRLLAFAATRRASSDWSLPDVA